MHKIILLKFHTNGENELLHLQETSFRPIPAPTFPSLISMITGQALEPLPDSMTCLKRQNKRALVLEHINHTNRYQLPLSRLREHKSGCTTTPRLDLFSSVGPLSISAEQGDV